MKKKFNDIWLRIICIPLLALFVDITITYKEILKTKSITGYPLYFFFILVFFIGLIWHINLFIHFKVRKYYERFNDKRKFIRGWFIRLLLYGANTIIVIFIASLILNHSEKNVILRFFEFLQTLSYALLFSYLIAGFYETRYFIYEWGKSFAEAEDLKKLNLQIQVDSLRNQINPHFLFNSLNTLSSLVNTDKIKAEKFIDEMSTVYRYVLQNNEKDLITLRDELQFIDSFFDLLKTRYEEGIQLTVDVKEAHFDYLLPPHTLQLLVENAVKHNVVSAARPLTIKIFSDELQQLIIENNVQQKATSVKSNKMGLANIFAKYDLLNQPQVVVNHTGHVFRVILPLMMAVKTPEENNTVLN